jgi:hypothetical protein
MWKVHACHPVKDRPRRAETSIKGGRDAGGDAVAAARILSQSLPNRHPYLNGQGTTRQPDRAGSRRQPPSQAGCITGAGRTMKQTVGHRKQNGEIRA